MDAFVYMARRCSHQFLETGDRRFLQYRDDWMDKARQEKARVKPRAKIVFLRIVCNNTLLWGE